MITGLLVAGAILVWFGIGSWLMWDDITRLCRAQLADTRVRAGRLPSACPDTFPREWTLARSAPFDQEDT